MFSLDFTHPVVSGVFRYCEKTYKTIREMPGSRGGVGLHVIQNLQQTNIYQLYKILILITIQIFF